MRPVLTPNRKRAADEAASATLDELVERAGAAVARHALRILGGAYGRRVHVLAGPGLNGADGRVAARRLSERGVRVHVHDALKLPAELPMSDLVIDAAFGSGFRDDWAMPTTAGAPVLAVDVPSGLDARTGVAGLGTARAEATVTFGTLSTGHLFADGPDHCGEIIVADIGLPDVAPVAHLVDSDDVGSWLPERARHAHKWDHGVRVVAGSPGMTGAAHLACGAAMRAGAGIVGVSAPGIDAGAPLETVDIRVPPFDWAEAVLTDLHRYHALVIGPGLGREEYTVPSIVRTVLDAVVPIVIDGDGLFALSWNDAGNPSFLIEREIPTVLTPHDGEYGRLTGHRPSADRIADARRLAESTGATVLLKGSTTVVADPAGETLLVNTGDARLATAGTGDVLAGVIGAFLAVGVPAPRAAAAAAWVHGRAAGTASDGSQRDGAIVASDLIASVAAVIDGVST